MADAGWYPDPQNPGAEAYWDGARWTGDHRPAAATPAPPRQAPPQQAPHQQAPHQQPGGDDAAAASETQYFAPIPASTPWDTTPQPPVDPYPPQSGQPFGGGQPFGSQPPAGYPTPYQQQPYEQQAAQQPTQSGGYYGAQAGYDPSAGYPPPTPPARSHKRRNLIIAGVTVVVLAGAGVATWQLWPSSSPSLTYAGKAIKNADATLSSAEASVQKVVTARHGTSSKDTRCYFAKPDTPAQGAKKTDIEDSLICGPVLFVDGDAKQEYLSLALTNTAAKGDAVLSAAAPTTASQPRALPDDATLVRPDGEAPPNGNGGLSVPKPPPAKSNLLTTMDSLGTAKEPATLSNSRMVGRDSGVEITAAGAISRYGSGDSARSAPAGQKLIAFQYDYIGGDLSSSNSTPAKLLLVDSSGADTTRALPNPAGSSWIVLAVPTTSKAYVQLPESGLAQTLSLPDGKPGAKNLTVLVRDNRSAVVSKKFSVPARYANSSNSVSSTLKAIVTIARLGYWAPTNSAVHASSPSRALLALDLGYDDPKNPGDYGFPAGVLSLRLPDGTIIHSKNAAKDKNKIADVWDVPASFTKGTVIISGSATYDGIKMTITKQVSFPVSFPAG